MLCHIVAYVLNLIVFLKIYKLWKYLFKSYGIREADIIKELSCNLSCSFLCGLSLGRHAMFGEIA